MYQKRCTNFLRINQSAPKLFGKFCLEIYNEMEEMEKCKHHEEEEEVEAETEEEEEAEAAETSPQSHDLFLEQGNIFFL